MRDLKNKIIAYLKKWENTKANAIASKLGVDKKDINSILNSNKIFKVNNYYEWSLIDDNTAVKSKTPKENIPLNNLHNKKLTLGKLFNKYKIELSDFKIIIEKFDIKYYTKSLMMSRKVNDIKFSEIDKYLNEFLKNKKSSSKHIKYKNVGKKIRVSKSD